ncbi:hypothetical protein JCM10213v2_003221 [Rhodosporidiobolus nylandii]
MAVRLSLLRRLWAQTGRMTGPRRRRLIFFSLLGFAEMVALIVVCALAYNDPCDKPLGPYLVMCIVRLAVAFPISYWQSISARPRAEEQRQAWERNRLVGSNDWDRRVRQFSDLISVLSLVLFFFANYWVISEQTCHVTAPVLYKTALAALILSWLWTTEFILYVILVLFFLPFFLIGMRWFGLGQPKHEVGPLSKPDIEKLPKRLFVGTLPSSDDAPPPAAPPEPAADSATPPSPDPSVLKSAEKPSAMTSVSPASSTRSPARQWWRLWRRAPAEPSGGKSAGAGRNGGFIPFPAGVEPIELPASQSACSICLCEYELPPLLTAPEAEKTAWKADDEMLSVLPCGHAFHRGCVGDWLKTSGRCPLYQRAVNEPKQKKGRKGGDSGGPAGGPGAEARV